MVADEGDQERGPTGEIRHRDHLSGRRRQVELGSRVPAATEGDCVAMAILLRVSSRPRLTVSARRAVSPLANQMLGPPICAHLSVTFPSASRKMTITSIVVC